MRFQEESSRLFEAHVASIARRMRTDARFQGQQTSDERSVSLDKDYCERHVRHDRRTVAAVGATSV